MNNKPYGWHCFIGKGKEEQDFLFINGKDASKPDVSWDKVIPLYTQQRPHNTVLVPCNKLAEMQAEIEALKVKNQALKIMNDGKNKIIEEYEHKYPDFFFMENDLMGKR